jgi:hypothetical protein
MTAPAQPKPMLSDFDRKTVAQTFDLISAALDDVSVLDDIPDGATLVLLPPDDPDFSEEAIALGIADVRRGRNVYFKHVPAGFGKDQSPPPDEPSDER